MAGPPITALQEGDRWYHEAVGIGRTTRQVDDTGQRTEVTWCIAM